MAPFNALLIEGSPGIGKSIPWARWMITLSLIIAPIVLASGRPGTGDMLS
jgi:hypothetical protein